MESRSLGVLALLTAALPLSICPAAAQDGPAAIVEEIDAPDSAIQAFDYLWAGDVVDLGADNVLVLGYLSSCHRETIVGGQVKVGREQSDTDNSMVHRQKVPCDPIVASLTAAQAGESGAVVLRKPDGEPLESPQSIRIYSTAPIFKTPQPAAEIVVRRLDRTAPDVVLKPDGPTLDTAGSATTFAPGGRYEARAGDASRVFEVDQDSHAGNGPAVSRLISF